MAREDPSSCDDGSTRPARHLRELAQANLMLATHRRAKSSAAMEGLASEPVRISGEMKTIEFWDYEPQCAGHVS